MKTSFCVLTLLTLTISAVFAGAPSFDFEKLKGRDNLQQTPLGSSGQWSLEKLLALRQEEGIALWRSLPAPSLEEMNGHYMGIRPSGGNAGFLDNAKVFNVKSKYWLGKAFKPTSAGAGEGYNRARLLDGSVERFGRMATRIGKSFVDGKPAYILDYSAFNNGSGVDELRKLDDAIYFGVLTLAEKDGKRSKPDFFILVGPTDEWVGPDKN